MSSKQAQCMGHRHPAMWRNRAGLACLKAEHTGDPKAKEHQLKLARVYERLAEYAEERIAS